MRDRRRVGRRVIHARNLVFLRQLNPLIHLDLAGGIGKVGEVHHGGPLANRLAQFIAGFDLDQLDAGGPQLMVERVAMGFLDDDFRLHSSQVRQLFDECFVVPVRIPASPDCIAAAAPEVTSAVYPSGSFSISAIRFPAATSSVGDVDKVAPGLGHHGFEFRTKDGTTQHGHGSFTIDDGLYSELFIGIARLAEAAHFGARFRRQTASSTSSSNPQSRPNVPRKLRRFHAIPNRMICSSYLAYRGLIYDLIANDRGNAIDFQHGITRKRGYSHSRARRPAVGKIGFEYLVHWLVVVEVREIDRKLQVCCPWFRRR